jgi:hypothetical protein
MGLTHVTTTVRRLAGRGKGFAAEFLVDTGAVDSLAPAKALRKAGINPEGKNVYELAVGSPVELEYGFARVSLMGEETVTPIIFGPEGYFRRSHDAILETGARQIAEARLATILVGFSRLWDLARGELRIKRMDESEYF